MKVDKDLCRLRGVMDQNDANNILSQRFSGFTGGNGVAFPQVGANTFFILQSGTYFEMYAMGSTQGKKYGPYAYLRCLLFLFSPPPILSLLPPLCLTRWNPRKAIGLKLSAVSPSPPPFYTLPSSLLLPALYLSFLTRKSYQLNPAPGEAAIMPKPALFTQRGSVYPRYFTEGNRVVEMDVNVNGLTRGDIETI